MQCKSTRAAEGRCFKRLSRPLEIKVNARHVRAEEEEEIRAHFYYPGLHFLGRIGDHRILVCALHTYRGRTSNGDDRGYDKNGNRHNQ